MAIISKLTRVRGPQKLAAAIYYSSAAFTSLGVPDFAARPATVRRRRLR